MTCLEGRADCCWHERRRDTFSNGLDRTTSVHSVCCWCGAHKRESYRNEQMPGHGPHVKGPVLYSVLKS